MFSLSTPNCIKITRTQLLKSWFSDFDFGCDFPVFQLGVDCQIKKWYLSSKTIHNAPILFKSQRFFRLDSNLLFFKVFGLLFMFGLSFQKSDIRKSWYQDIKIYSPWFSIKIKGTRDHCVFFVHTKLYRNHSLTTFEILIFGFQIFRWRIFENLIIKIAIISKI